MAGIALPQLAPASEDRVSGALSVDGSLRFDDDKKHNLTQTIGNGTNGFTLSFWMKPCQNGNRDELFDTVASTGFYIYRHTDGSIRINNNTAALFTSNGLYRDTSAFYNIVFSYKPVAGSTGYGLLYVNGKLDKGALFTTQLYAGTAKISSAASSDPADYYLSQWYLVDGLQLGPEYFGYTDPLTNTWGPKKFKAEGTTVNDGTDWSGNYSGSDPGDSFDGTNPSQNGYSHSASSLTITFPKPLSGRIIVYGGTGGGGADTYTLSDGSSLSTSQSYDSSPYFDALDFGEKSAITSLTCSAGYTLHGVSVDGVMLVDSTTQNLDFGSEGFYLPMDGSSPIGEDKSGKGNDWTPNNFGGSVELNNSLVSGARPILNTTQGGSQAGSGVFGSKVSATYVVSSSSGGGNPYIFTGADAGGTLTQPTFNFIRGATYTFDYSGADTHPLKFSTTENGTRAGGTEYTDGRVISSDVIKFTVPHNAPDTLYYYCANHTGMGNSISITTDETKADPYAWKNVIALPLVGANDDVSNQINVGSTTKVMTNGGNAAASSAQSNFYGGSFVFDNASDKVTSPNSTDYAFGTGDFTVECWYYMNNTSSAMVFAENWTSGTGWQLYHRSSDSKITWYVNSAAKLPSNNAGISNKWTHVAVCRTSGTTKIYLDGIENGSVSDTTDYSTSQVFCIGSQQSNDSNHMDGYLQDVRVYKGVAKYTSNFIPASTNPDILPDSPSGVATKSKLKKITDGAVSFDGSGDALRVADHADLRFGTGAFTIECFVYFNSFDDTYPSIISKYTGGTASWIMRVKSNGKAIFYSAVSGGSNNESSTDPIKLKKWHHIAMVREGTGSNQAKMYVDGKLVVTATDNTDYTDTQEVTIGAQNASNSNVLNGFMSNVRIIKGTALYTSEFSPPTRALTNATNTKLLCCQSPTSATAAAVIPSGSITVAGNPTVTTFNPINTNINTVRGQETGYATWNPLSNKGVVTTSGGNLVADTVENGNGWTLSTIPMTSGKYYCEMNFEGEMSHNTNFNYIGIVPTDIAQSYTGLDIFRGLGALSIESNSSKVRASIGTGSGATQSDWNTSIGYDESSTIGIAIDCDTPRVKFYVDGKDVGTFPYTMAGNKSWVVFCNDWASGYQDFEKYILNAGQKPFKFPPPDGFQPMNLSTVQPEKVIARPDQYVGVTIYTGNGSTQTISGLNHKPDLVWLKSRTAGGGSIRNNVIVDSVRGKNDYGYRNLYPNLSDQQYNVPNVSASSVTSLNSKGFDIGGNANTNHNTATYVAWCWKAGGDKNTFNVDDVGYASAAAAGLTAGTLTISGASVGTKQGFSIIKYAGSASDSTFPHGLTQAPDFYIIKCLDVGAEQWRVYHSSLGADYALTLNTTAEKSDSNLYFNDTEPTSTVASVYAGYDGVNNSGRNYIAYLWHDVPGLQKFGSYEGNESTNGPFIELGFRPAIVMVRNADESNNDWKIYDGTRNPHNAVTQVLYPNSNSTEDANTGLDFLSNGFKLRDNGSAQNGAETIVYAAWAEAPMANLYGAQSNAR